VIVDASAVLAVIFEETGHLELVAKLADVRNKGIGTPTLVEVSLVLGGRLGEGAVEILEAFIQRFELTPIPFSSDHWHAATEAFLRYGKGRHPAALNFGDCLTYAVAKVANRPLLFVGNDFSQTDLAAA
jgi:ribonuclease VapC